MGNNRKESILSIRTPNAAAQENASAPSALDRWLMARMLRSAGLSHVKVRFWNGEELYEGAGDPVATMGVNSRTAIRQLLLNRDIGFGDCYSNGQVEVDGDLETFLCDVYESTTQAQSERSLVNWILKRLEPKARRNTLDGSLSNIHHHYDLGNQFYKLWLDEEMQYTCAYFPDQAMTIEQAQAAKMEHVCRKLQLRPGQTVVEAGCGWGSLAAYMARNHGVKVRSFNISHEQIAYAVERASREGLSGQVEYVEDDYRNISGEYDVFVSVGMLEHVGKPQYRELGDVIRRCLAPNGRALVHSIGRNVPRLMNPWIEKRIFPGAYPPALREMMDIVEPHDFSVLDIENLRLHYELTLRHWLARFDENESVIEDMFDDRFVRSWRLYLVGSICAFKIGHLQLFQMLFARGQDNSVPWSRKHLYELPEYS